MYSARSMSRLFLVSVALVFGCTEPEISGRLDGGTRDSGRDARADDATTGVDAGPGVDVGPRADGGTDGSGMDLLGQSEHPEEICDNEIDDDRDGIIDNGCPCAVGTMRPCYNGPAETRNVGSCHEGIQYCESLGATAEWSTCRSSTTPDTEYFDTGTDEDCDGTVDEGDGKCLVRMMVENGPQCRNGLDDDCDGIVDCDEAECPGVAGCPSACQPNETNCYGGYDDDCDGDFDCEDSDCAGNELCMMASRCPPGQTGVYTEQDHGTSSGGSSIGRGNGRPQWEYMECGTSPCVAGQVYVRPNSGGATCVLPPAECPAGNYPSYAGGGSWICEPPCEWIIHYGHLFGFQNHCADRPSFSCPSGQVPTFVRETETWQCRTTCNNGLYDRITVDGVLLCIPC